MTVDKTEPVPAWVWYEDAKNNILERVAWPVGWPIPARGDLVELPDWGENEVERVVWSLVDGAVNIFLEEC